MKKFFMLIMTILFASFSSYGCGKLDDSDDIIDDKEVSSSNVEVNANEAFEHTKPVTDESSIAETTTTTTTPEPVLMTVSDARPYNDGVAWVNSGSKWCIVDTEGKILNSFPNSYTIVTDFEGGFSIIDPKAIIYMSGRIETSDEVIIVNSLGEIVFDLRSKGYKDLYSYEGLSEGSLIVEKNIDNFDKSGDFYYHYDLNSGLEKEICASEDESDKGYKENCGFEYMGDGFYIRTLWDSMTGTFFQSKEVLVFHNYISDEILSFRDNPEIINTLNGNNEFKSWDTWRIDNDKLITEVNDRFFIIDLKCKTCKPAEIDYSKIDGIYGNYIDHTNEIGVGRLLRRWGNLVRINSDADNHYFDFVKNKYYHFEPKCNYECEIRDYKNGFFLITTKNENNTVFFTILDENYTPLFSPKRYSDTTTLFNHYLICNEENGSVTITDLQNFETNTKIENAKITYVDYSNSFFWITTNQNTTECHDIEKGKLICKFDSAFVVLSDFNDGYVLVKNIETNQYNYISKNSETLKIIESDII